MSNTIYIIENVPIRSVINAHHTAILLHLALTNYCIIGNSKKNEVPCDQKGSAV